jgi:hypothetical protein
MIGMSDRSVRISRASCVPGQLGHRLVGEEHVVAVRIGRERIECGPAGVKAGRGVAELRERLFCQPHQRRLVVDDQHRLTIAPRQLGGDFRLRRAQFYESPGCGSTSRTAG